MRLLCAFPGRGLGTRQRPAGHGERKGLNWLVNRCREQLLVLLRKLRRMDTFALKLVLVLVRVLLQELDLTLKRMLKLMLELGLR